MLYGVDISDNNQIGDWRALARAAEFALIKATENDDYRNTVLAQQDGQARYHGMEVGYYHFAQPGLAPWALQAQKFAREIDTLRDAGSPLALDVERGKGNLTEWVLNLAAAIEAMCGRLPALYSSPAFIAEHFDPVPELARLPLWLASWRIGMPAAPAPWSEVAIWQNSDRWTIPGTDTQLDRDLFPAGGRPEFRNLGVTSGMADIARIKVFLAETAVTLDGWAVEVRDGFKTSDRARDVADEMETRAAEARELSAPQKGA